MQRSQKMVCVDTMRYCDVLQTIHCLLRWDNSYSNSRRHQVQITSAVPGIILKLVSIALLLVTSMPKEQSPEVRLSAILQEQQRLVTELKDASPARQLQIQAEIVALSEEQSHLLQEAGAVTCFIFSTSGVRGTGWIEEERNFDGSVRQYRYGYYGSGKSNRRYVPKLLVGDVQRMIASGAKPPSILEFLEKAKTRVVTS